MTTYLLTLEIDVLDKRRLIAYAREDATNISGLSQHEIQKAIATEADAILWLFDDNTKLSEAAYAAQIVGSSCEPVGETPSSCL